MRHFLSTYGGGDGGGDGGANVNVEGSDHSLKPWSFFRRALNVTDVMSCGLPHCDPVGNHSIRRRCFGTIDSWQ